jgi:hypothetical protein
VIVEKVEGFPGVESVAPAEPFPVPPDPTVIG